MKTVCVIQARMKSSRFPGKVMADLGGHPVLEWTLRACRAAIGIDEVMIATSTEPADDVVAAFAAECGASLFRGSESDVLSRFVGAAAQSHADVILRATADEPFIDPDVISHVVWLRAQTGAAYCSNIHPRTFADGLDIECFTREALLAAHAEASREIDKECVTTWIVRNQSRFPAETVINPLPGQEGERYVLDTINDMTFCQEIVNHWSWDRGPPSQINILSILDRYPDLRGINAHHPANERFFETLAEEPIHHRSYERSQRQFRMAREIIPLAAQTFSKSYLQYPQPSPLFLTHGEGGECFDVDGNSYVDLVSALLPNILGYCDHDVDTAIRRQLSRGISFSLATELEHQFAETLCRLIPCAEAVRFGKSGTDVTTAAIRVARAFTGREKILICGGYHGWADWSTERNLGVPEDVRKLTERVRFGDIGAARAMFDRQTVKMPMSALGKSWADIHAVEDKLKKDWIAAVIVEPESDPSYLEHLRYLCTRYGALLIFDEVITGFRFDLGGAQKLYGVTPDLATFGKAMANGMPLSALVGRRDIMKRMEPPDNIFFSGTFFGETLSIAAAIATIKKLERDDVITKLWSTGSYLAAEVQRLLDWHGMETTVQLHGLAPFMRLKFRDDQIAALFRKEMVASGTLVVASHNLCAAHGQSEIKRILKSYDHALSIVEDAVIKGDIAERLAGATVGPMVRA